MLCGLLWLTSFTEHVFKVQPCGTCVDTWFIFRKKNIVQCMGIPGLPRWLNGKESAYQCRKTQETQIQSLNQKECLEEEMAAHSHALILKIPWTEEPGWRAPPCWHVSVLDSFLWMNNIPVYWYTTFCSSIHSLMGVWIVSTSGLL